MKKAKRSFGPDGPSNGDQAVLDLEDALLRLAKVRQCIALKDEAEAKVKQLQRELVAARRRAKEKGWDLTAVLGSEKRKSDLPAKACEHCSTRFYGAGDFCPDCEPLFPERAGR